MVAKIDHNIIDFLSVKNIVDHREVYFIARAWAFPPLTVRYGKIINKQNHNYVIDSGGETIIRHEEETFDSEDLAWARLRAAYPVWLELYS